MATEAPGPRPVLSTPKRDYLVAMIINIQNVNATTVVKVSRSIFLNIFIRQSSPY
jgi:hypothetical protein